MGFFTFVIVMFVVIFVGTIIVATLATPAQRTVMVYGPVNAQMICPHCNVTGKVHTKVVSQKKGVSGGKAAAAVLTAGVSVLATGLSRKENNTQAHCANCNNTWFF